MRELVQTCVVNVDLMSTGEVARCVVTASISGLVPTRWWMPKRHYVGTAFARVLPFVARHHARLRSHRDLECRHH